MNRSKYQENTKIIKANDMNMKLPQKYFIIF